MRWKLKYYDPSTGLEKKIKVDIIENRIEIESKYLKKTVFVQHINSIELTRDPTWRYLIGGSILTILGILLMQNVDRLLIFFKTTDQFLKLLVALTSVFLIIFGVIILIYWWLLRVFILTIHLSGDVVHLYNRREKPLKEIYDALRKPQSSFEEVLKNG